MSTWFTVKKLKELLNSVPDEALVVLSSDAEGNGFSPTSGYTQEAKYIPGRQPWERGDVYTQPDPKFSRPQGQPAIVLWPDH